MGYSFGKVYDPKTITYIKGYEREGVFVDIFPVDKVESAEDLCKRNGVIQRLFRFRRGLFWLELSKYGQVPFWRIVLAHIRAPFWHKQTINQITEEVNLVSQSRNSYSCRYAYMLSSGIKCVNLIPIEVFENYVEILFEGKKYMAVRDTDFLLKALYGNYWKLPPVEKRVKTHMFKAYWK